MIIAEPAMEERDGLVRLTARVEWEDTQRDPQEIVYALPAEFKGDARPAPESFVLVGALAALRMGEGRVAFDSGVCPDLYDGLQTAMAWLCRWNRRRSRVRLDVNQKCSHETVSDTRRAGVLLSGGVDSLALLRANALAYNPGHPRRMRLAFVARGIWAADPPDETAVRERLDEAVTALEPVAQDLELTTIPVYANFRTLTDRDVRFWQYEFQGAALASIAHLFGSRVQAMSIGSTWDVPFLTQWGSHPLLDPNYGTHAVVIKHEQSHLSRLDKVGLIAEWPTALSTLRVCNRTPEAVVNCGRCEKCVRTKLELATVGALERTDTFTESEVTPGDVGEIHIPYGEVEPDYREVADALSRKGDDSLAAAVRRSVVRSRIRRRLHRLKRFSRRLSTAPIRKVFAAAPGPGDRRRARHEDANAG